ncbi:T9SS type A sorting domain-containing protein [Mariniflexile sp.]|uniref:T9SS type A sorting domain-containing protein n=1 Tax=Mariniflexile sp. TaxID=1979402 RepID=UPI0035617BCA
MASLNASAGLATGSSGSITYSIGQVFYTYEADTAHQLQQGIQHADIIKAPEEDPIQPEDPIIPDENTIPEDSDSGEAVDVITETPVLNVLVYPNPASDFITIATKGMLFGNQSHSYQLFNFQGQLVMQNNIHQDHTTIPLNNLATSIYILRVYVNEQLYKTFKILKK